MNVLPFAFLEKFLGRCSMDVNQSSKYCKKTFRRHENGGSSTLENGRSDGLSSNLWKFMSLIFIISKTYPLKNKILQFLQLRVVHTLTKVWNIRNKVKESVFGTTK